MLVEDTMTPDEAIELMRGPLGEAANKAAASYVAPIFWLVQDTYGHETVPNNGTIFFVNAGEGPFAVTANHVYKGYLDARVSYPKVECVIAPQCFDGTPGQLLQFNPEERLIDRASDSDIATFRMTAREIEQLAVSTITVWPPMIPEVGKGIVFAGFPGHERLLVGPKALSFAVYPGLGVATNVTDRQISCYLDRRYLLKTTGFGLPPPNYNTAGMSGSPLLTVVERNGFVTWALGGVIYEGNADLEILFAARADCIMPDGRLQRDQDLIVAP